MENKIIKIKKLHSDSKIPTYAHVDDGCCDLYAYSIKETSKYIEYATGICMELPEGYDALIFPRSSISNYDIILSNSVGYIDNGYKGEILFRFKRPTWYKDNIIYKVGDRIGQLRLIPQIHIEFQEVVELGDTIRNKNGFGSSGE